MCESGRPDGKLDYVRSVKLWRRKIKMHHSGYESAERISSKATCDEVRGRVDEHQEEDV